MFSSSLCLFNTGGFDLVPDGWELGVTRDCYSPLQKIKSLALKGNPTPIHSFTCPLPSHYTSWAIPDIIVIYNAKKINYTSLRYPVIYSYYPLLNFTNGLFPSSLPTKTPCTFIYLACHTLCPFHPQFYHTIFLEKCKIMEFLRPPLTVSFSGPNIFFSTPPFYVLPSARGRKFYINTKQRTNP